MESNKSQQMRGIYDLDNKEAFPQKKIEFLGKRVQKYKLRWNLIEMLNTRLKSAEIIEPFDCRKSMPAGANELRIDVNIPRVSIR